MDFIKYQHLERFGTSEVLNIELGECYVFPKIDGTNASLWMGEDGKIQAGSRKRHLSLESDNAGFLEWARRQAHLIAYLEDNPTHRLFGEWLVPHALKTYRDDAWRRFYVFDVCIDRDEDEILHESDSKLNYLNYEIYSKKLGEYDIDYIAPICKIQNGTYEQFIKQLEKNVFLIQDGKGAGEGIVIKNYEFKNRFNRQTWAKIVTSEFKEKHAKVHGASEIKSKKLVEEEIAKEFVTKALCDKVYAKIDNDTGFNQRAIPRLLNTVYYDVIKEDAWEFIKKHKNPTINFGTLQHFVFQKVKDQMPHIF
jgi:hypothetical protein